MTAAPEPEHKPEPETERMAALAARVDTLESHLAHVEAAHQDMSEVLARQWEEIDRLTRTLKLLHDQMIDALPAPSVEKPPHY